jgi:hypothetical protein
MSRRAPRVTVHVDGANTWRKLMLTIALVCMMVGSGAAVARSAPYTRTFSYTGQEQVFTVPLGVSHLSVRAIGGAGATSGSAGMAPGGAGGTAATTLTVSPGARLYVEVGASGATGGGWNGGGTGPFGFAPAGGASDIRTLPGSAPTTLFSRSIVAGGGGAAGLGSGGGSGGNAAAPGVSSSDGAGGMPGTQSAGGVGGSPNGAPGALGVGGAGGSGGPHGDESAGGGGGGGLFGGGGGGGGTGAFCCGGGGGGGSSYAPGGTIGVAALDTPPSVTLVYTATPTATTDPVGAIGTTAATLPGRVIAGGAETSAHFEYGVTTAYGSSSADQSMGAAQTPVSISAAISSLQPATTYHYRLVATNANGTTASADRAFTTLPPPPGVVTLRIRIGIKGGWSATDKGLRINSLKVTGLVAGSKLKLRCRSCHVNQTSTVRHSTLKLKKLRHKLLRRGQKLTITVTRAGAIGEQLGLTVRRYGHTKAAIRHAAADPFRTTRRCLSVGSTRPRKTC